MISRLFFDGMLVSLCIQCRLPSNEAIDDSATARVRGANQRNQCAVLSQVRRSRSLITRYNKLKHGKGAESNRMELADSDDKDESGRSTKEIIKYFKNTNSSLFCEK